MKAPMRTTQVRELACSGLVQPEGVELVSRMLPSSRRCLGWCESRPSIGKMSDRMGLACSSLAKALVFARNFSDQGLV